MFFSTQPLRYVEHSIKMLWLFRKRLRLFCCCSCDHSTAFHNLHTEMILLLFLQHARTRANNSSALWATKLLCLVPVMFRCISTASDFVYRLHINFHIRALAAKGEKRKFLNHFLQLNMEILLIVCRICCFSCEFIWIDNWKKLYRLGHGN